MKLKIKIYDKLEFWVIIFLFIIIFSCDNNETNVYGGGIEPQAPYEDPVWHPSGEIIGFNHVPIKEIYYNHGYERPDLATYVYQEDSAGFWIINADGTNQRRLLPYQLGTPAWSPDGNWISFSKGGQIFKMPFDGNRFDITSIIQLTFEGQNSLPAWSPDGKQIAYHESICGDTRSCGIWIKNLETGTNEFIGPYGIYPDWHPYNGSLIYIKGDSIQLYNNILKTNQFPVDIAPQYSDKRHLKYSPDGTKISFTSLLVPFGGIYLFTVNADGAGLKKLTSSWVSNFSWSPHGKIVYLNFNLSRIDKTQGTLWTMDADGNNQQQLTHNNIQVIQ